jgi:regulator of replication initiation timing
VEESEFTKKAPNDFSAASNLDTGRNLVFTMRRPLDVFTDSMDQEDVIFLKRGDYHKIIEEIRRLTQENAKLREENAELRKVNAEIKRYLDLKDREGVVGDSLARRSEGIKHLLRTRRTLIDAVIFTEIIGAPRARRSLQRQRPV